MKRPKKRGDGGSSGICSCPIGAGRYAVTAGERRYKIQVLGVGDQWGDLKGSTDGGPYRVEVFRTKAEAQAEVDVMVEEADAGAGEYRVVDIRVPGAIDFYG